MDLLTGNQWIGYRNGTIQILSVHIHSSNLAIFVGGVIIDAFISIATTGIARKFIFISMDTGQSTLLRNAGQNVEKLTDTFGFGIAASGIQLGKGGFYKTGRGGHVTGKSDTAHAQAERLELNCLPKSIFRWL